MPVDALTEIVIARPTGADDSYVITSRKVGHHQLVSWPGQADDDEAILIVRMIRIKGGGGKGRAPSPAWAPAQP